MTLDAIVGYDPDDPLTSTVSAAPGATGYAQALDREIPLASWRIGVLESGFGEEGNPDADPVNRVVRGAIARMEELGVHVGPSLEIESLGRWITETSAYIGQAKSDITGFLADRPEAPAATFMEIYESRQFHPLNDLFDNIAEGPDALDDVEYRRVRLKQEQFRELIMNIFAERDIDFIVYPTVQVIPPTRAELAAKKYSCLTFPTNTVIGAQAGLPALTIPVGFSPDGLPVGMELLGPHLQESKLLQFALAWERAAMPRRRPVM
jgi:Asp-tRNA(Asn)/Glu-tRNA(Gln) amidotransferase A subunit family amidase